MARFVRKEDIPYDFRKDTNLVLVEYQDDGRLYLVDNPQNLTLSFDDYLVVTYTKTDDSDTAMPYSICKCIGFVNESFEKVAEFMGYNLKDKVFEFDDILPRFHNESIVKNLSRDGSSMQGGVSVSADGKDSSQEGLGSPKQDRDNPDDEKDDKGENPEREDDKDDDGGNGADDREIWKDVPAPAEANPKPLSLEELLEQGKIFDIVRKVH